MYFLKGYVKFDVKQIKANPATYGSRTGLSALVNKLYIGNIIQQSSLDSIY
ncbi:hypothetical protein [Leptospira noguchii]|uniref:Uncharacterized protein n=1 Tax=Leptospira noguchii serovar Autumnalis str. ZUN142 TaxID=1085540 RepID=M6UAM0_9LEPT|nr:hypothetical protein [Leptospira noguchii]EMO27080.1 hypothetical protein LEP1GSC170_3296 [Leptospira interrogans serovar Bataviae str. HAI135]EMO39981.1 hypothetical protein LEP1GSC186_1467 [Leptospira noguchii serovar Autumnalis str. ZUN142]EMS86435.1 hypothetical protein LEP1GSC074_2129 [Leptospira noguchii str. Hook]UOG48111.1 hypothetical protein MAL00_13885 [Leptospira noguchii]UOG59875.1 hypothetical protein MAL07_14070 [Leptospira noguchii]